MNQNDNWKRNTQILFSGLVALALVIGAFLVFGTSKESLVVGRVKSIEKTGFLFKTTEIQMLVEGPDSLKLWNCSVADTDTSIVNSLKQSQASNRRIQLEFREKYVRLFWQPDSKNIATKAEILDK